LYAGDHEQARRSFSQAIARDPQAKYFVNLATADLQLGYLGAAADALREALQQSPTSEQAYKAKKLFGIIAQEAKKQGLTLNPPISPAELGTGSQEAPVATPRQPSRPVEDRTQAAIAERVNQEGKELMYADRYQEAAKKFQEAVARVPEPKYFVNLCTARLQTGELDLALTACRAAARDSPNPDVQARAAKLIARIREEARNQGLELHGP
jgi:tetratricopeptide (TPR) repeat protein